MTSHVHPVHGPDSDPAGMVLLRRDLIADGLTDNQIARLVTSGALHRIRHGAYAVAEWPGLSPQEQHRVRSRAILRTADPSTVLTHTSSLVERGAPLWGVPLGVVHTTRLVRERAGRRAPDWVPHRGQLDESQIETVNGVRISVAPHAALELTTVASAEAALVAVNGLLRMKMMTLAEFRAEVERCVHWPNSLNANLVVHLANPHTDSVGEDRFLYLVFKQRLPMPETQVEIADESGVVFAVVDFLWRRYGVFVEFDGRAKYLIHRRPGETLEEYLMREKAREEKICQLTGWTCIRVTWSQLSHPVALASRIRRLLAARAPGGVVPLGDDAPGSGAVA